MSDIKVASSSQDDNAQPDKDRDAVTLKTQTNENENTSLNSESHSHNHDDFQKASAMNLITDDDGSIVEPSDPSVPILNISFLPLNGERIYISLDSRYILAHKLDVKDPHHITIGALISSLFNEWPKEWDSRPSSTENIRLIFMGRPLDTTGTIEDNNIKENSIIHLSIRPDSFIVATKTKSRNRTKTNTESTSNDDDGNNNSGCCCIIM